MSIQTRPFGALSDGTAVTAWTITNENGLTADILDYGATIQAIRVPDREGRSTDVVLGCDDPRDYAAIGACFGATIGRFANRIAGACFDLNGKTYRLAANDGENHIHGGPLGFHRVMWQARPMENGQGVAFSRRSCDGEEGYPGNLDVTVEMFWQENALVIRYRAVCDQDTILNFTNHSYFNLDGGGSVTDQTLFIAAEGYTPSDESLIPTGQILPVAGTAMDFRAPKAIGRDIDAQEACVGFGRGYDTNLVLTGAQPAAIAVSRKSGIRMEMTTDQPGVQLFTPTAYPTDMPKKKGWVYGDRPAFCLETQHFPDCIHRPDWPSCVLKQGEVFQSQTVYAFSVQ